MIYTPYETLALNRLKMTDTIDALRGLYITQQLKKIETIGAEQYHQVLAYTESNHTVDDVFFQPVVVRSEHRPTAVVMDTRPYGKMRFRDQDEIALSINPSFLQLLIYSQLVGKWQDDAKNIVTLSDIPMVVYGNLLSETISRRLGLDGYVTVQLMALFQIFYVTRAEVNVLKLDDAERTSLALSLSRKTRVPLDTHNKVMQQLDNSDLEDIGSLIKFINKSEWSPRLKNLSLKDVYQMVINGWFGQGNQKETMMVALEFPPAFISIIALAAKYTAFQKTPVGQIVKRLDRANNLKGFVNILTGYTNVHL